MTTWFSAPSRAEVAVPAFTAGAVFFTLTSWSPLSTGSSAYLVPLFFLTLAVAVAGLLLRALHLPGPAVAALQLGGVVILLNHAWARAESWGGWIPTPSSLDQLATTVSRAVAVTGEWAAPVPARVAEFPPLLIVAGAGVALLADVLAATARRVPLAGLPLLAAFTAPVSLVDGVAWLTFVLAASFFVLALAADQAARLAHWGRVAAPVRTLGSASRVVDNQPHQVTLGALLPAATRIGLAGVGIASLAPLIVPSGGGLFGGGGDGNGGQGNGISVTNPLVDLKRDLTQGPDVPVVYVQTDEPDPSYLRLTVLDDFDGNTWTPAERFVPDYQRADGELPPAPGLAATVPRTEFTARVRISPSFRSTWLPVPYPATSVRVGGDWRYDRDTLDLLSARSDQTTAGLQYQVTGLDLAPDPRELADAGPPPRQIAVDSTHLPATTPPWVEELARTVTADAASPFERAVRLQEWFRRDGGFQYSLERGSGSGLEQLELFLGTGPGSRTGYCEQFAAAMAMMARSLGIPARVAVGFLRPDPLGNDRWVYSTRDLHSWPELFFRGAGWIRFEPTPQARAGTVPGYTSGPVPRPGGLPTPSVAPTQSEPTPSRPARSGDPGQVTASDSSATSRWLPAAMLLVLAAGLVAAPRSARRLATRQRFGRGSARDRVEGAWAELRATALDLGLAWDDGVTLRRRARALVPSLGRSGRAVGDLESLVLLLERSRYSLAACTEEDAARAQAAVLAVTESLRAAAPVRARRRATWLPASLWRNRRTQSAGPRSFRTDGEPGSRDQDRVLV